MKEKTRKELLKIVKNNYSEIAADFNADRAKPVWPELKKIISEIIEPGKKYKALDVGCGNGRLTTILPMEQIDYFGVDNCQELIDIASKKYLLGNFSVADILDLNSIKEINFDIVFAIAVLHHIPSKKLRLDALKQLKNKLKSGGILIMTNWNMWPDKKFKRLIWKFFILKFIFKKNGMDFGDVLFDWRGGKSSGSQRYYHAFRMKELENLIKTAGFNINKIYKDEKNYYLIATK